MSTPIELSSAEATTSVLPPLADPSLLTTAESSAVPPLTKTAAKKLAKRLAWDLGKPERKLKEKAKEKARKERRQILIATGVIEKPQSKKSQFAEAGKAAQRFGARIVLDMAFDELMTDKEIKSMDKQIGYCYSANRLSVAPLEMLVTSFDGKLKQRMDNVARRTHESWKGVEWWEGSYEDLWKEDILPPSIATSDSMSTDSLALPTPTTSPAEIISSEASSSSLPLRSLITIGLQAGRPQTRVPKSSIVYLTGDSPNVLESLDPTKTYILGGIVDKNRHKLLCYNKAVEHGIEHAQLPISKYLPEMLSRKILTVNQVFEIMVKWAESRDWEASMRAVMPLRKFTGISKAQRRGQRPMPGTGNEDEDMEMDEGEEGDTSVIVDWEESSDEENSEVQESLVGNHKKKEADPIDMES